MVNSNIVEKKIIKKAKIQGMILILVQMYKWVLHKNLRIILLCHE